MTPREQLAREKANKLINWFEKRDLPNTLLIGPHMNITDLPKCIDVQITTLNNAFPYSAPFVSTFNRLLTIKKKLDEKPI